MQGFGSLPRGAPQVALHVDAHAHSGRRAAAAAVSVWGLGLQFASIVSRRFPSGAGCATVGLAAIPRDSTRGRAWILQLHIHVFGILYSMIYVFA